MVKALGCLLLACGCTTTPQVTIREQAAFALPVGFAPTNAVFLRDGNIAVWSNRSGRILRYSGDTLVGDFVLPGDPVLAVTADSTQGHDTLLVYRSSAWIDTIVAGRIGMTRGGDVGRGAADVFAIMAIGPSVWWMRKDEGVLRVMSDSKEEYEWALPDPNVGELVAGLTPDGFVLQEFNSPYRLFVARFPSARGLALDELRSAPSLPQGKTTDWRGLRPMMLRGGWLLQTFTNVVSGGRMISLVRPDGRSTRSRLVEGSFAFHDTDTVGSRLLAIRRRRSHYEVVLAGVHVTSQ